MNTTITIKTSALADRATAARFVARATRRAGAGLIRATLASLRILATGRAPIEIRKTDALMYLALAAGMSPDDALRAHRLMVARENIDTPAQRQLGVAC
jgi:methylphosphotriester-DNA--protein-cysteine methyltransferase